MRARWCLPAVTVAWIALSTPASADDKADAQALLTQGNALAGDGDYLAALEKYRAAYARYQSPKILLNIGTALRQLGRNVDAAESYEAYLRDPGADPARKEEVERILREIDAVVARVVLSVEDAGTRVRLDGKPIAMGAAPVRVRVEPGEHTAIAELEGRPPQIETFKLAARQERVLVMRPAAAPPPAPARVVVVRTVDGSRQRAIALGVGGLGLAGVVVGSVFGWIAHAKNDAAATHCELLTVCDAQGFKLGGEAKTDAAVSTVAFAVGGAAVVGGVVLYFTAPRDRTRGAAQGSTRLMLSPSGRVTVAGDW